MISINSRVTVKLDSVSEITGFRFVSGAAAGVAEEEEEVSPKILKISSRLP